MRHAASLDVTWEGGIIHARAARNTEFAPSQITGLAAASLVNCLRGTACCWWRTAPTGWSTLALPATSKTGDIRRAINAELHVLRLRRNVLTVHGVVVRFEGAGALLLGSHGAGKSTIAESLVRRGAQVETADSTVIEVHRELRLIGGSTDHALRPAGSHHPSDRRWRTLTSDAPRAVGLPIRVVAAVRLCPQEMATGGICDPHLAHSQWFAASAYHVTKLLECAPRSTQRWESERLHRRRIKLTKAAAAAVPVWELSGEPDELADRLLQLARF